MAKKKQLTPEEIVKSFKDEFKTKIIDAKIKRRGETHVKCIRPGY